MKRLLRGFRRWMWIGLTLAALVVSGLILGSSSAATTSFMYTIA